MVGAASGAEIVVRCGVTLIAVCSPTDGALQKL